MHSRTPSAVESALFVANRSSGSGRSLQEIDGLRDAFYEVFQSIANRVFVVTDGHDEVVQVTQDFLRSFHAPSFLLSGGGGGTNRALVQGLMHEVEKGTISLDGVQISSLRLGSGNLIPKYFGMPLNPLDGMRRIAGDLSTGRSYPCCVYRCTFHYPEGATKQFYGLTLAGLGQFARVPDDIKRWREKHARLMRWASLVLALEATNTLHYIAFSILRALRCIAQPRQVEWVEVRQAGRRERFRLLAGLLLNFDFPQLPIQVGCDIGEPRLMLCCIPYEGRGQTLWTLMNRRQFKRRVRMYPVTRETPIQILFPEQGSTILALDEDTFAAPTWLKFDVARSVNFVTGGFCKRVTQRADPPPIVHTLSLEESR